MKNLHWIVLAILAAGILWYYLSKYKAVPKCLNGTLTLASSCASLRKYAYQNPCWQPGVC